MKNCLTQSIDHLFSLFWSHVKCIEGIVKSVHDSISCSIIVTFHSTILTKHQENKRKTPSTTDIHEARTELSTLGPLLRKTVYFHLRFIILLTAACPLGTISQLSN